MNILEKVAKAETTLRWLMRHGDVSIKGLTIDLLRAKRLNRVGVSTYFLAKLHTRAFTSAQRRAFLGLEQSIRLFEILNPMELRFKVDDKSVQKSTFHRHGIRVPETLGFLHPSKGRAPSGRKLRSLVDLRNLLREQQRSECVIKPPQSANGYGFHIFRTRGDGDKAGKYEVTPQTPLASLSDFERSGYICEEYIRQHDAMAAINPHSVNTLRIWTYRHLDSIQILGAYLRTSRNAIPVDNRSAGGLCAMVDMKSGTLSSDFLCFNEYLTTFKRHPVSGVIASGTLLPFWQEVRALAQSAASVYEDLRLLAFDVAITPLGPICIEANAFGHCAGQFLTGFGFGLLPEFEALASSESLHRD